MKYSKRNKQKNFLKRSLQHFFSLTGYEFRRVGTTEKIQNYDEEFLNLFNRKNYSDFSMLSRDNFYALYNALKYISNNSIPGDIVECGVWRGGAMLFAADCLVHFKQTNRRIWLFDTFEGMTPPTSEDIDIRGNDANKIIMDKTHEGYVDWCYADIADVKSNLKLSEYPSENYRFVKGDVLKTIPENLPEQIAILRLDTDWYESTKHEMEHLYPQLTRHGVLIIDDYGTWQGSKKAVDEYFTFSKKQPLLHRVDHTAVTMIKD